MADPYADQSQRTQVRSAAFQIEKCFGVEGRGLSVCRPGSGCRLRAAGSVQDRDRRAWRAREHSEC